MKVGFLQFNPRFGEKEENLQQVKELLSPAKAGLLVLPEFFATGYLFTGFEELSSLAEEVPSGPTCRFLIRLAQAKNCFLAAGLPEVAGGKYYNSAVLVGPEGYLATYRKIHLFNEEKDFFTPGDLPLKVYDLGELKLGLMICFDWLFPELARSLALQGADLLAQPANLVLPYCPEAMRIRCLENRVYAITANRIGKEERGEKSVTFIGKSQVVDPFGRLLLQFKEEEGIGEVEIDPGIARNKSLLKNDLFLDRRPEFYSNLCFRKEKA